MNSPSISLRKQVQIFPLIIPPEIEPSSEPKQSLRGREGGSTHIFEVPIVCWARCIVCDFLHCDEMLWVLLSPIFSSLLDSVWPSRQSWQHTCFLGWQTVYAELCVFPFRMLGYKHAWWPATKNNQNGHEGSGAWLHTALARPQS